MVALGRWLLAAPATAPGGISQICPEPLSVSNGGFESGQFAPWYVPNPSMQQPQHQIVAPGYLSKHALQLNVAASNLTETSIVHPAIGEQCAHSSYRLTFALNWGTYAGPASRQNFGCRVFVQSSYCYGHTTGNAGLVYATPGAGWKTYSYTCSAVKTGTATYTIDFSCIGNATYAVPAFGFQVDSFNIELLDRSARV